MCTYFVGLATQSRLLAWVSEMRAYLPLQKTVGWSLFLLLLLSFSPPRSFARGIYISASLPVFFVRSRYPLSNSSDSPGSARRVVTGKDLS